MSIRGRQRNQSALYYDSLRPKTRLYTKLDTLRITLEDLPDRQSVLGRLHTRIYESKYARIKNADTCLMAGVVAYFTHLQKIKTPGVGLRYFIDKKLQF